MFSSCPERSTTLKNFPSPQLSDLGVRDDLSEEYFRKLTNPNLRRFSTFPAVSISQGRIVQTYGNSIVDVTHLFYSGPQTNYCIIPETTGISKATSSARRGQKKKAQERTLKRWTREELDSIPPTFDSSIFGSGQNGEKLRRKPVQSVNDKYLRLTPVRRLASSGTGVSDEKTTLQEWRASLGTTQDSSKAFENEPRSPAPTSASSNKVEDAQENLKKQTFVYMTNGRTNRRLVSKGELKKTRLSKSVTPVMATTKERAFPQEIPLTINRKVPAVTPAKDVSSYQIRQKYADGIERNWLIDMMEKAKKKNEWLKQRYDFRLDMFYSPDPDDSDCVQSDESDGEYTQASLEESVSASGNEHNEKDDNSVGLSVPIHIGHDSTAATTKAVSFGKTQVSVLKKAENSGKQQRKLAEGWLRHFDSTNVLVGIAGEMEESSASDIETVLQNGQLQERRRKHKMYHKRRRQQKRYKPFIQAPVESENEPEESQDTNEGISFKSTSLSAKQLRQMRLKVKKKQVLRGKRRFRQIAIVVFIFVQFRRILAKIRRSRRNVRKRTLNNAKKVKWNDDLVVYSKFERQKTPIQERFMKDFGIKLLKDIGRLPTHINTEVPVQDVPDRDTHADFPRRNIASRFQHELRKVDMADVRKASHTSYRRVRRFSDPGQERPDYITFTLPEKPLSKRSDCRKSKSWRKSLSKSKTKPKQSVCDAVQAGRIRNHLPPIVTISSPGCRQPCDAALGSANQGSDILKGLNHQSRRKRSNSPPKRPISCSSTADSKHRFLQRSSREVKISPQGYRPRSYSESFARYKREISLRELLKDADIPAKEIAIQIIERKRRKRRRKMDAAIRTERLANEGQLTLERAARERQRTEEIKQREEAKKLAARHHYHQHISPYVTSGVAWHKKAPRPLPSWTTDELDLEITKLTGLFFEMRNCSYIRWNNKDQAILRRLAELENLKI